ncbi:MAG TPA: ABC transporter substrate-binding protein [Stellaceae bacterium]|nr:ABC transporter substrate-binding protein [Stellaceae bacterium]
MLTPLVRQAFAVFSAFVTLLPAGAAAPASRVISLNLCTDQLVLALADRSAIVSVTYLARDCAISAQCRAAASEPINYGTAEELVAAEPDLVLGGRYTTRPAIGIARRLGMKVLEFDPPSSLDMVRRQIRDVAEALGRSERGEAMIADLDGRLAALPQAAAKGERPVAAVYQANSVTVGANSLIDAALQVAGVDNLARRLGLENYMYLPLETLIADRPDLLILNTPRAIYPSLAESVLRHPAIAAAIAPDRRVIVSQSLWICGGPEIGDAIALLAQARARLVTAQP